MACALLATGCFGGMGGGMALPMHAGKLDDRFSTTPQIAFESGFRFPSDGKIEVNLANHLTATFGQQHSLGDSVVGALSTNYFFSVPVHFILFEEERHGLSLYAAPGIGVGSKKFEDTDGADYGFGWTVAGGARFLYRERFYVRLEPAFVGSDHTFGHYSFFNLGVWVGITGGRPP